MKILHLEIAEFYLTIERSRRKVPPDADLVIHFPEEPKFVVTQSSTPAAAGIRSRMPIEKARKLWPSGVFVPADFRLYAQVSDQLNTRLRDMFPFTEQLDFYEWFSDLSDQDTGGLDDSIRRHFCGQYPFRPALSLSRNKFLAKLGNDAGRSFEDASAGAAGEVLLSTGIEHFWGIPKKWIGKFKQMGVNTIGAISLVDPELLEETFPKASRRLSMLGRGEDDHEVRPFSKPSRLTRNGMMRRDDSAAAWRKLFSGMAEELSGQLARSGHVGFSLRMEITGGGQQVTHRYRFLLPTVRPSSILVGATSMLKKMESLLPPAGALDINLSVEDIVYDRELYQMRGGPRSDLQVLRD